MKKMLFSLFAFLILFSLSAFGRGYDTSGQSDTTVVRRQRAGQAAGIETVNKLSLKLHKNQNYLSGLRPESRKHYDILRSKPVPMKLFNQIRQKDGNLFNFNKEHSTYRRQANFSAKGGYVSGGNHVHTIGGIDQSTNWTETNAGNNYACWYTTSMSRDGNIIIAGEDYGKLYISTNGGGSWTETQPVGNVYENWHTTSMSADGDTIIAGGFGLYISTNRGSSWTEIQPAENVYGWQTVSMSSDGTYIIAGGSSGRLYISTNSGSSWKETQPAGNTNEYWQTSSISSDGTKMIAGIMGGRLYMSTNSGNSWTETQPLGNSDCYWQTTSMSSDGTRIIAGVYFGRIYLSTNGGSTWSETQPAGDIDKLWETASISLDGTKIIAGEYPGRIYVSTNGGSTWMEINYAGNSIENWQETSMNADGTKLIAGIYNGTLVLSTNTGNSWTEIQPADNYNKYWRTSSINSNGIKMIVGDESGRLYLSTNSGSSWAEIQPTGNLNESWVTLSLNSDGTHIIAGNYGRLYLSSNTGGSWTETQPAGNVDQYWYTTSMSSDGTKIIAGVTHGRLFISTNSGSSWIETQPAGNNDERWWTTSMSSDGTKIIAGGYSGLYLSTNGGGSWAETLPAGIVDNWAVTSMSSDGTIIIAGSVWGRLYLSTNFGSSWTETQPAGNADENWLATSMSSDGTMMIVSDGFSLYMSTNGGISWAETQPADNVYGWWRTSSISSNGAKMIAGVSGGRLYLGTPVTVAITGNAGIAGAVLGYSDGIVREAAADENGNYSIKVPYNWSGTVTPSKDGYTFSPASRSYSNITSNQANQNYTISTAEYAISRNAGIAGAVLAYTYGTSQQTVTADGSGNYSISVIYNWSGKVTPSKPGYTFIPASRSYTNVTGYVLNQNYTLNLNPPEVNYMSVVCDSSFTAVWSSVPGAGDYQMDISSDSAFRSSPSAVYFELYGLKDTSKVISGLTPGSTYYYRVRAFDGTNTSINSDTVKVQLLLDQPTNITASSDNSLNIVINWQYSFSDNITGFTIERGNGGSFSVISYLDAKNNLKDMEKSSGVTYQVVGNVDASARSFTDTTAAEGESYSYAVIACDSLTGAVSSNGINELTEVSNVQLPLKPPIELRAVQNSNKILLTWENRSLIKQGTEIERSKSDTLHFKMIVKTKVNDTTYTDKSLTSSGRFYYRAASYKDSVLSGYCNMVMIDATISGLQTLDIEIPKKYELYQNFPNPFNPSTIIKFALPEVSNVSVVIFNLLGQKVQTLFDGSLEAGYHQIIFNADNLSSGVYIYRIQASHYSSVKKLMLLK